MVEQQMELQKQRMDEVSSTHQHILEQLAALTKERRVEVNEEISSNMDRPTFKFLPKLEFPYFDGTNPRNWMKKCSRYFALCKIPEAQWVDVASIHLTGRAETWFASYIAARKHVDWNDFVVDVCNRFREDLGSKVVEDFHNLHQIGTVEDYLEKFEDLKALLLLSMPMLPDDYFVSSFVGGLKPHLKSFVKALNPLTLDNAVRFARLHEEAGQGPRAYSRPPLLNGGTIPPFILLLNLLLMKWSITNLHLCTYLTFPGRLEWMQ